MIEKVQGAPPEALDLTSLPGDAGGFAARHPERLRTLSPAGRWVWGEIASHLAGQKLRDKRTLLWDLTEALAALTTRPDLEPAGHQTLLRLAERSARLIGAYSRSIRSLVEQHATVEDFAEVTHLGLELGRDIDVGATFLEHAPGVARRKGMEYLRVWQQGARDLGASDWWAARGFLQAGGRASHWLETEDLPVLVDLGARVAARSRHAVKGLFQALPALLASMKTRQLIEWVELGLEVTRREEDLILYMSYGSKRSQEAVEHLCRETSFSSFRGRVALLLEAFLGRPGNVKSIFDLLNPASIPPDVPAVSDGGTLYVRPSLGCAGTSPLALYRLVALHAAAHERFGSFGESDLAQLLLGGAAVGIPSRLGDGPPELARFLVAVLEDFRIDHALFHTLPGLRADAELVLRETYSELDVRTGGGVPLTPPSLRAHLAGDGFGLRLLADEAQADALHAVVAPLRSMNAGPRDSLEAAASLYDLVAPLWLDGEEAELEALDLVAVPYPPYYDHFLLGLKLASLHGPRGAGEALPATPTPSSGSLDVPASFHPSEVIEGLEIQFRDKASDDPLLALEDEEQEDEACGGEVFTYDEWDYEAGDHRADWCTVRCRELPMGDPSFVADTIERYKGEVALIRRQFERLRPDRIKRFFRQVDGDELDLDALTEALVDRAAGAPMTDKLFIRRDKKKRDVAVLFLLDMSDSTDQLVDGQRRIIDVEKEGLVLLAEAIGQLDDEFAIMGFTSRGRKLVDLYLIKDFAEDFDDKVSGRIGGIEPLDYTRLGAALRHATDHLSQRPAAARLIVLLSDGRPYDMGYGDMTYAMEDTKMALAEARRLGINAFCITVDPKGPDYLEDLFGVNRYTVIQHVEHMPTKLPRIYRNLTV